MLRQASLFAPAIFALGLFPQADLTAAEKRAAVEALSKAMIDRYVSKQKAEEVAKVLQSNLQSGAYDAITNGSSFAIRLTEDANRVCGDAHLRINFSAQILPVRQSAAEPSATEIANQRRNIRLANAGFHKVERLLGNIGYIKFDNFMDYSAAERPMTAAMSFVSDTDALIFDIRSNGGGSPETVRQLCNYLFEKPTHINSLIFRRGDAMETVEFRTEPVTKHAFVGKPIYVLVSKRTGSGAEEFAYNLQTQKRAMIIGENTWGGANPGGTVRLNDHFMAFIPVGMAKNPITGTNWEGTGVTPDVKINPNDALKEGHIRAIKGLLESAEGADADRLHDVLRQISG